MNRSQPPRVIDQPSPCFTRMRLGGRRGPYVAARVYRRLGLLTAEINGCPAEVEEVWHSGELIDEETYWRLLEETRRALPF
jgi:hypothetical protein